MGGPSIDRNPARLGPLTSLISSSVQATQLRRDIRLFLNHRWTITVISKNLSHDLQIMLFSLLSIICPWCWMKWFQFLRWIKNDYDHINHVTGRSVHNNASIFGAQLWDPNKFVSSRCVIGCACDDTRVTLVERWLASERTLNHFGTSGRKRTHKSTLTNSSFLSFLLSLFLLQRDLFVHN